MNRMLLRWVTSGLVLLLLVAMASGGVTVDFSTNLSAASSNPFQPIRIAHAPNGDLLVLGYGDENSLPALGSSYRPFTEEPTKLVLARIDASTYQLVSRTFLPISSTLYLSPEAIHLVVDSSGSPWVAIAVSRTTLPVLNPPIGNVPLGSSSLAAKTMLLKLSPEADAILFSTYIGCSSRLETQSMAADASGKIVIAGMVSCATFPTTAGAYQENRNSATGSEGFVLKLDALTGSVQFGTYFGTANSHYEHILRTAVDSAGRILIGSTTSINDLPVSSGTLNETLPGTQAAYLGALSGNGASLEFGTYFGSEGYISLSHLQPGPVGSIYIAGSVVNGKVPLTPGAFSLPATYIPQHFVARISHDGKQLLASSTVSASNQVLGSFSVLPGGDSIFAVNSPQITTALSEGAFAKLRPNRTYGQFQLGRLSADGTTMRFLSLFPANGPSEVAASIGLGNGKVAIVGKNAGGPPRSPNAWPETLPPSANSNAGFTMVADMDSPVVCSYAAESEPAVFPKGTSSGALRVTAPAGCPWSVVPFDTTVAGVGEQHSGIGNGTVALKLLPNLDFSERTTEVDVGSSTVLVRQQAGDCSLFELSHPEIAFDANPVSIYFSILTPHGCTWSGGPSTAWFASLGHYSYDTSPREHYGSYYVTATALENSFEARSGVLPLKGRLVPVTQAAGPCTSSVSPATLQVPKAGGDYDLQLQTVGSNCHWQTHGGPGVNPLISSIGAGSATVPIRVEANPTNSPRETYFILANKTIPIVQAAGTCTASFTESELVVPHIGGWRGTPFIGVGDACLWNPTTNVSWIKFEAITNGSATMFMTLEPNLSPLPRTAIVQNLGASIKVTQLGNNMAHVLLHGPWDWPIKINGTETTMPYEANLAIGTQLTLEPQLWAHDSESYITRLIRWSDGAKPTRTLTLATNETNLILESVRLRRVAVEKVNGGTLDLRVTGFADSDLPEFYSPDPLFGSVHLSATAVAEASYRFVGWIIHAQNGYYTGPDYPSYQVSDWVLRPRFERINTPSGAHVVPESIEFIEYPLSTPLLRYIEVRGLPELPGGFNVTSKCPGGASDLVSSRGSSRQGSGTLIYFTLSQIGLRELGKGVYHCTLNVKDQGTFSQSIPMTVRIEGVPAKTVPPPPAGGIAAITNAATFAVGPISPGGLFTVFGTELASGIANAESIPLPELLKEAQIRLYSSADFVERYAGLLYVSPLQINFHVPEDLPLGSAEVRLYRNGALVSTTPVGVVKSSSGVFWVPIYNGSPAPAGYGTRVSGNNQFRTEIYSCPAGQQGCNLRAPDFGQAGDDLFLSIYATGLRGLRKSDIRVFAGAVELPVDYLGPQGFFVGLDQVNLRVPRSLAGSGVRSLEMQTPTGTIGVGRVQF